jgi:drug/metabolite transporter (DMT)-like permease
MKYSRSASRSPKANNAPPLPGATRAASGEWIAIAALLAGAVAIAASAIFVRISETGPVATAFWRVFLALPWLCSWHAIDRHRNGVPPTTAQERRLLFAAGCFFAGDLAVWHLSIMFTSVANSTFLANVAPIFVVLASWLLFAQRISRPFLAGMALALIGAGMMVGSDFELGSHELFGDALGIVTAMFYAAYQMSVTALRRTTSTARIMAWSGVITAAVLLPLALASGERFLPQTGSGWLKLVGLALTAQVAGQSLIAYAMAQLRVTFTSVGLLFQPVVAALLAWWLLGEPMTALQIGGGIAVLAGIGTARRAQRK